jgi:hypothetical protein
MPAAFGFAFRRFELVAPAAVAFIAAVYYAGYFLTGYNVADDGHYAQVAYEFHLGAGPRDVRFGYGLLWHHLGAWLFALTGPSFAVVQGIFFAAATLTAALTVAAAHAAGSRPLVAAAAGLAVALVPAFPPTAFYALCAAANVWAQARLTRRADVAARPHAADIAARPPAADIAAWPHAADIAAAAAVLGLTFQIRADFGYVFSASFFAVLLCLRPRDSRGGAGLRAAAAGTAAFFLVHLPLAAAALGGGWIDMIFADYLRIPKAVLYVLRLAFTAAAENGTGGANEILLARTPLSALWRGQREQAALALATWGPLFFFAAFALFEAVALRRTTGEARRRRAAADVTVLAGGLAAFPHYFLFRPDLAHIANFMPGFIVLLAVFVGRMIDAVGRSVLFRAAAGIAVAVVSGFIGVYLWLGLVQPGTGSMQAGLGRDRLFIAENGVRVRINAEEEALLTPLRDLIAAHSRPDQPIVCVPYCPGVAFMTARRLLFAEHYVDNSFLIGDPGWLERAIRLTVERRPPVIVVFDWAINGTPASRFDVWARPYIDALERLQARRIDLPGLKVYLLAPGEETR